MSSILPASLLLVMMLVPGQFPAPTVFPNGMPRQVDHHFPVDDPQQAGRQKNRPRIDVAQAKRDADQLAKLAGEIPSAVEHANKGVVSKDLNDQLKRIEKLSKQLRREIFQ